MKNKQKESLKKITDEQRGAIEALDGTVCVKAGAGTGKTTVLVERFIRLFMHLRAMGLKEEAACESILAVTFTNKAAGEMKGRLEKEFDRILPENSRMLTNRLYVSTIDSFCSRLLRENALELGINPNFRILDQVEDKLLFMKVSRKIFDFKGLPPVILDRSIDSFIKNMYSYIVQLRNNAVSSRDFLSLIERINEDSRDVGRLISKVYSLYEQEMRDRNLFNFSGLLLETLRMLTENRSIGEKCRGRFRYVLVDEYQDTTPLQHRLLRMFSDNYFVVGDIKQSIYGFRGAEPENIEKFNAESKTPLSLTQNFRSYNEILEVINSVLGKQMKNYEPINSNLVNRAPCCELFLGANREEEAEFIAGRIMKLDRDKSIDRLSDVAILLRSVKTPVSVFENILRKYGIPFVTSGGSGYFERPEIKDIVAFLGVINNPFEDISLVRVLRSPVYRIKNSVLAKLAELNTEEAYDDEEKRVSRRHLPLYDALGRLDEADLKEEDKAVLSEAKAFIDDFLSRKRISSLSLLVYRIITESNYLHYCSLLPEGERNRSLANVRKLSALVQKFEERNIFSTLADFITYLKEVTSQEAVESEARLSEENAVHIMSIHRAKGLEFPVVFVADVKDKTFPGGGGSEVYRYTPEAILTEKKPSAGRGKAAGIEPEEKRLLYVAMTRAKQKLIVSGSLTGKGKKSRFMDLFIEKDSRLNPELSGLIENMRGAFNEGVVEQESKKYIKPEEKKQEPVSVKQIEKTLFYSYLPQAAVKAPAKHFSVSEIAMYDKCPLKYKYRYVFNLPFETGPEAEPEEEQPIEAYAFGSIIHRVLQEWVVADGKGIIWDEKRAGKKFCELVMAYGRTKKESEDIYNGRAKEMLNRFAANRNFNPGNAVALEQPFSIFIDGFEVRGAIDRIDRTPGGYHVIDYKTGRKKKEGFQLTIYKMGAERALGYTGVKKLSLWFLGNDELVEINVSRKDEQSVEEKVKGIIKSINKKEFNPTGTEKNCKYCEYKSTCIRSGGQV